MIGAALKVKKMSETAAKQTNEPDAAESRTDERAQGGRRDTEVAESSKQRQQLSFQLHAALMEQYSWRLMYRRRAKSRF